jgi:V8-like Glu-specific endopeptidase
MSLHRSAAWKLGAGLAALGVASLLAATSASASPASSTASVGNSPSVKITGPKGVTQGVLVKASPALTAYWNRDSRLARVLQTKTPVVKNPLRLSRKRVVTKPQGPTVKVAGKVGAIQRLKKTAATPALGPTGTPWWGSSSLPPATTTGKVFFTDHKGGNWVCSGSLVNSPAENVVITAGHCVYGTAGGELPAGETWHSNWVFAPDYSNGYAPYGYWTARQLWTLTNYVNNGDEQDDLGAAILNPNYYGENAVALLGGQGIAWNEPSSQYVYDFGYPAESPFNGQTLQECNGEAGWNGWWWVDMEMLTCNFTGGSSGGPWLMDFNGEWGYINSVNDANGYTFFGGQMGGLYFGNNAGALYEAVANI